MLINMDKNILILILFSFIAIILIYKALTSMHKIKEMRMNGHNTKNNNLFDRLIKSVFLKNLPD